MEMFCSAIFLVVLLFEVLNADETMEKVHVVEGIVGHSVELPCNVTTQNEDDQMMTYVWNRNESSTAFYSRDMRSGGGGSVMSQGDRYEAITVQNEGLEKLRIVSVRATDAGLYRCRAMFRSSPTQQTLVQLNVVDPPQRLWVGHENGTRVATATFGSNISQNIGPYYVGEKANLYCVVFGGEPQGVPSWWADNRQIVNATTELSRHRVRSDLSLGPLSKEDHGRVVTCLANNNDRTPPLSVDITVEMYFNMDVISLYNVDGNNTVRAGDVLSLRCHVLGARPVPPVLWRLNESQLHQLQQNITINADRRLVQSNVEVLVDRQYHEAQVKCCAPTYFRDMQREECSQPLYLTVLYPPEVHIVIDAKVENNTVAVVKGSAVNMYCNHEAYPPVYELIWFHENNKLSKEPIHYMLQLKSVSESDAGEYTCGAVNDYDARPVFSEPVVIDVIYPAYCNEETLAEYGIAENQSIELSCSMTANPEPTSYHWVIVNGSVSAAEFTNEMPHTVVETDGPTLTYQRPNDTAYSSIFCMGVNNVSGDGVSQTPCAFLVTDKTVPRPPTDCRAVRNKQSDITVICQKDHDGGLPQKFKLAVTSTEGEEKYETIDKSEPSFKIQQPTKYDYKLVIVAYNGKGESNIVEIDKDSIIDDSPAILETGNTVTNLATLTLALFGGVALVALAACGLVLCSHDRGSLAPTQPDPPLCAYNTEESNCDTYHDSDDNSECNVRRTDSFRRAVSRYPSKNFDVRRTSSFHSARYINDELDSPGKVSDFLRHNTNCRVHSLQNISRKREMEALCDHLVLQLPRDPAYSVAKPMNTFCTIPRKTRHKSRELNDEVSEITQTSDGFSLPPPPDEFGTYRAATRIRDVPAKSVPTYAAIRKNSTGKESAKPHYNNVPSQMNTVGLPTISGTQPSMQYTYHDNHGNQDTTRSTAILTTFQSNSSRKESGL